VDEAEVPSKATTTAVVLDVRCVGWHCCAVVQDAIATPVEVASSTMMRKWKWLFLKGCKCKSLISTVAEVLNL
jgi:hypothetical protein